MQDQLEITVFAQIISSIYADGYGVRPLQHVLDLLGEDQLFTFPVAAMAFGHIKFQPPPSPLATDLFRYFPPDGRHS